ncbi:ABC transporter permease [Cellulomonas hominis]
MSALAQTAGPVRAPSATGSPSLTGTATLTRFVLRQDRVRNTIWVVAIAGMVALTLPAFTTLYATAAERASRATVMRTPVGIVFGGPGYGIDDYTIGAMVANELVTSILIAVVIMSIQLVVRHTRADEESGRGELVRAAAVGRAAPTTAALLSCALVNLAIGLLTALALVSSGLAGPDSLALGLGITVTGLVFGAVAAVCAQVAAHARSATGLAMAVAAVLFTVRALGDVARLEGSTLSWFSPFAWAQQTRPYVDLRWWPLLLSVVLTAALLVVAFALSTRRDLGAGLVAPRSGRAAARPALSGILALHARQQRGSLVAWALGTFAMMVAFGTLVPQVADMIEESPDLARVIGAEGAAVTDAFLATMLAYVAMAASAYVVSAVQSLRTEETTGRAELTLSTPVSRRRWMLTALLVAGAGALLLQVLGGFGLGLGAALESGDAGQLWSLTADGTAYVPIAWLLGAATALLFGAAPRYASLVWAWFTYGVLATMLGALLDLPRWAMRLSPFDLLSRVPAVELDLVPTLVMTVVVLAAGAAGVVAFRRRDLTGA